MRVLVMVFLVMLGAQAHAGAWMRSKGEGFLSFNVEYNPEVKSTFTSLFIEYGITPRITSGVDLGFADDTLYKAVAFGRYPLSAPDTDWQVSLEMGMGVAEDEAVLRPGLMLGRGLELGKLSGWLSIEALAYYEVDQDDVNVSTDLTLGVNLRKDLKLLVQLQNGNQPMNPDYLDLATSVVVKKAPGLHLELGVKTGLKDTGSAAFKLGLWHKF
ncbi:MAG: hypothetical protein P1U83_09555 [Roseovarius sp.]|nr:hypothetical protein [Roseovarius sp.]